MNNRLKIGQEVLIRGYVDEIRKDTIIIQNEGGYFGTVECEITNNEMSSTNGVLDKIRAEIKGWQVDIHDNEYDADKHDFVFERIFEIIDKYRTESEVEDV